MGRTSVKSTGAITYDELIVRVREELRVGIEAAEFEVRRQRARTYWQIGRWIDQYTRNHPESAPADLRRLAADIGFQPDVVIKMRKFYRCFPSLPKKSPLNWSQYRALLSAPETERGRWLARAQQDCLGEGELYRLIGDEKRRQRLPVTSVESFSTGTRGATLEQRRGRLYVYKAAQSVHFGLMDNEIMVDCGFAIRRKVNVESGRVIKGGHLVVSVKTESGYLVKHAAEKGDEQLYTYQARLLRIIDGDTMELNIDVGFDVWLESKVRLRGIDAAELSSDRGRRARHFVVERLERSSMFVVKTWKPDKYGRYLADLFYHPGETDPQIVADSGIFLNQELLDEGLAVPYTG